MGLWNQIHWIRWSAVQPLRSTVLQRIRAVEQIGKLQWHFNFAFFRPFLSSKAFIWEYPPVHSLGKKPEHKAGRSIMLVLYGDGQGHHITAVFVPETAPKISHQMGFKPKETCNVRNEMFLGLDGLNESTDLHCCLKKSSCCQKMNFQNISFSPRPVHFMHVKQAAKKST